MWDDCSKFFYYNGSSLAVYTCRDNYKFNGFMKCCVPKNMAFTSNCAYDLNKPATNNVSCHVVVKKEENALYCDSFYECCSSKTIVCNKCNPGQLFDWISKECRSASSARTVPGCARTPYDVCALEYNWRNRFCSFVTYIPKIFFGNIYNSCKSATCKYVWFI